MTWSRLGYATLTIGLGLVLSSTISCTPSPRDLNTVKVTGSDTMVNLANAWAEAFKVDHPNISVPIKGGGSGVGIANLLEGKIDVATSSRPMKPKEIELAKKNSGKEPKEFIVGRDALAIYVSQQNPLETISIPELAEIYGEGGTVVSWKDLNVDNKACSSGEIIRVSRQNSSGTYAYFKEAVLGDKREYKQGATSQSGSADVVDLVSHTPCAIGYSGMGYRKPEVKIVKVSKEKGQGGVEPTITTVLDGTYPISRPLYLYTLGEPSGAVQEFIQWIRSDAGQKIVEDVGYVPMPKEAAAAAKEADAPAANAEAAAPKDGAEAESKDRATP